MLWLKNVEDVRSKEWSKSWLWDVRFKNGPTYFNDWFPATTCKLNRFTCNPNDFGAFIETYAFPISTTYFTIDLDFIDSYKLHVQKWISSWVNDEIFGGGEYVGVLEEIVKQLDFVLVDTQHKPLDSIESYYVFPTGSLFYSGNSESSFIGDSLSFVIAGAV